MEGHEFIWTSMDRLATGLTISLIWNFVLSAIVIGYAVIIDGFGQKIKRLENFLKDDMEQEEIMHGKG